MLTAETTTSRTTQAAPTSTTHDDLASTHLAERPKHDDDADDDEVLEPRGIIPTGTWDHQPPPLDLVVVDPPGMLGPYIAKLIL